MLVNALIVFIFAIAGLLAWATRRPEHFQVERSLFIEATPERLFGLVDCLREWNAWSPWHANPATKQSYTGPEAGKDARYAWTGPYAIGTGEMTVALSEPPRRVALKLALTRPLRTRGTASFRFMDAPGGTQVTWRLDAHHGLEEKLASLVFRLDRRLGDDLDTGLARLKAVAEGVRMPAAE